MKRNNERAIFEESLKNYNPQLANENLGIFINAVTLRRRRDTKVNIVMSIIGFIIGMVTGRGFYVTSDGEEGILVAANDGLYFFETKKGEIQGHLFFPYTGMQKAVVGRNIIFSRILIITGNESGLAYRLECMYNGSEIEMIENVKQKMSSNDVSVGKRIFWHITAVVIIAVIAVVAWQNARFNSSQRDDRDIWEGFVPVLNSPTFTSPTDNYRITFLSSFVTTIGAGARQTDAIVIFFDYEALQTHGANRPFARFVIYQDGNALEHMDNIPARFGRGLLSIQRFEAGEVFNAARAVIPQGIPTSLRIVQYNNNGDVVFSYEITVGDEPE